jgi:hypothetical protein
VITKVLTGFERRVELRELVADDLKEVHRRLKPYEEYVEEILWDVCERGVPDNGSTK